ncbi:Na(+) H(+) antiporter subunit D [Rubellimicrobium mesophilum DSM 19309]|uniref:Na(+) H(+) antiporter subunit D n=1 Tax=Rubellimicrobium mesophilum DSM 19309 TaxID=442562 RepID=A0A017HIP1_9RHOB|nr:monovalent cation/H+ antiporter subunit D [Rubellimicrobium mesophilum]EYD74226.1 Na(+) H(+) antiporter subunit D [Rubellimicrobium mesophilum DSM 19309]
MTPAPEHLVIAPILIPFFAGALMLLYGDDRQRKARLILSFGSAIALLLVALGLLGRASQSPAAEGGAMGFYLLGDWASPFGIVLVLDRLSAMMLLLLAVLALPALTYSLAGWQRQGTHFHALFQFLLMGLNGAFLTGDLFNLFVFFEVLLAASYGLLLHGSGAFRVGAGLHYIAVNLTASLMFLIGVSLIYGVTGTLNMAHLAGLIPTLSEADRPLLHAGAAILALAFLVKAGMWPLSFWLPTAYSAGAPPVAAIFAVMTKVGVYAVLRLSMLMFGPGAGPSLGVGAEVLIAGGMLTMLFGLLGVLGTQALGRMAGHLVLVSSGTVLAVIGFTLAGGGNAMLAGGLYYLVASTLASSALFLLIEPLSREDGDIAAMLALTADAYGIADPLEDEDAATGLAIPGSLATLAVGFGGCLLVLAGMPPLAGFVGKLAILSGLLSGGGLSVPQDWAWTFLALLLLSGLATLIGLVRVGVQVFWTSDLAAQKIWALEVGPPAALLLLAAAMTVRSEDVLGYMDATSRALHSPPVYTTGVSLAPRVTDGAEATE